ncbi:uncharacterized protein LOC101846888 [Aplysia californica]|uniref:DNA-directed primase/polymerase protein n=1 Tax=Aplysia californica TaxID=6500 RepID=A0ABM0JSX0_APLCA|nr:uncharacterized protein LOC101846888 [Aplysia californica]
MKQQQTPTEMTSATSAESDHVIPVRKFYGSAHRKRRKCLDRPRGHERLDKRDVWRWKVPLDYHTRLLGPTFCWQTFYRQRDAFKFVEGCNEDVRVFAFERSGPETGPSTGQRQYLVTSTPVFWHYYRQLAPDQRHHYEIIPEGNPCKLYFDLEFMVDYNPRADGPRMVDVLIQYVSAWLYLTFGVSCGRDDVLDLDASTKSKFSRHLIFQLDQAVFQDNVQAGQFVRRIFGQLVQHVGHPEPVGNAEARSSCGVVRESVGASGSQRREGSARGDCGTSRSRSLTSPNLLGEADVCDSFCPDDSFDEEISLFEDDFFDESLFSFEVYPMEDGDDDMDAGGGAVRSGSKRAMNAESLQSSAQSRSDLEGGKTISVSPTRVSESADDFGSKENDNNNDGRFCSGGSDKSETHRVDFGSVNDNGGRLCSTGSEKSETHRADPGSRVNVYDSDNGRRFCSSGSEKSETHRVDDSGSRSETCVSEEKCGLGVVPVDLPDVSLPSLHTRSPGHHHQRASRSHKTAESTFSSIGADCTNTDHINAADDGEQVKGGDCCRTASPTDADVARLFEQFDGEDLRSLLIVNKDGVSTLFCDLAVYTRNRNFRLFLSSKGQKQNPLLVSRQNTFRPPEHVDVDEAVFYASLISLGRHTPGAKVLQFESSAPAELRNVPMSSSGLRVGPSSTRKVATESKQDTMEGWGCLSPFVETDHFILSLVSGAGRRGVIRHWTYFPGSDSLIYDIAGSRWCGNVGREHRSNNVMYVVDLRRAVYYQKCYDPDCQAVGYKSEEKDLPRHCLPWTFLSDDEFSDEEMIPDGQEEMTHVGRDNPTSSSMNHIGRDDPASSSMNHIGRDDPASSSMNHIGRDNPASSSSESCERQHPGKGVGEGEGDCESRRAPKCENQRGAQRTVGRSRLGEDTVISTVDRRFDELDEGVVGVGMEEDEDEDGVDFMLVTAAEKAEQEDRLCGL